MSMTAHCVFIAKINLNIEPQTIFTAVQKSTSLTSKWISIQVTAAERTRERDEAAQIARLMSEWEFTERGTRGS